MLKAASKKCPCRCSVGRVQPENRCEDWNQNGGNCARLVGCCLGNFLKTNTRWSPTSYKWIVTPINGLINGSPRV